MTTLSLFPLGLQNTLRLASRACLALTLVLGLQGCTSGPPRGESVGSAQGAVFVNGGFETGTAGNAPPSWTVQTFINNGITLQTPQTRAGLNLANGGDPVTVLMNGTNQPDPDLGATASLRFCRYGTQCALVNFHGSDIFGHGQNVNSLSQTMTIGAMDIDATDGKVHVRFAVAPVLQNPAHTAVEQPYYFVQVTNTTTNTILYTDFNLSAQAGVPWKTINGGTMNELDYVDWSLVDVAPGPALLAQGDSVKLEVIAAGCSRGRHFGEVYVDGAGATVPGLFVSGVGPAQTNPGSTVTYNMTYKNGSAATETGVTIDFTTPPNTTFLSLTPPPGATCTTPALGAAGTIVCTLNSSLAAGAAGTFQVKVNLSGAATGQLVCGNYDIRSNQETALLGSKIVTTIGCAADADCASSEWCNISANQCTAKLTNGTTIPSDGSHTNPTLNGSCTASAASLVCQSGVCDAIDNKCGKLNGSGLCSVANQATVCRSGVCDPDSSCGYATNHGPCSAANQATVCRSGSCSANLLCEPAGGCNVDADCALGQWCNETSHTCSAKLSNGTSLPTDPPHVNPTLDGSCSVSAASLVCQAGVCDSSDKKCGYAVNGGPCTAGTAAVVCRSATCSANGFCRPLGGCNVDADCSNGQWCAEASHTCTPKLANGTTLPQDAPHLNPTLDGKCTVAAGALVCQATVCDAIDDKCGKLNGSAGCSVATQATVCRSAVCDQDGSCGYDTNHGPCTTQNAATVCRSASCSSNGLCRPVGGCNVDADCALGQWCNETTHACAVKLTNGTSLPSDAPHANPTLNGICSSDAATLVCQSAVCDASDNKCGFGSNRGPCTVANAATVCRSGVCSANLTCRPAGGCNVDSDCSAGNWCNETQHVCSPVLPNGTAIPTDTAHVNPTLNGSCAVAAALLVCQSSVCDAADNECGYDVGHGSCSQANGAALCRSGACSHDGTCRPANGCNVDADCSAGNWCQESAHVCKAPLVNGRPLPSDAPHSDPKLDGKCTQAAATLVCQSSVCDAADDECGYALGDGPCTAANGPTVCRSGSCSTNGLCQPAAGCNIDADCAPATWCNEAMNACLPRLDNGMSVPKDPPHRAPTLDGKCSEAAAALVCASGVCDSSDDECGFPNGVGPCTKANGETVCRSGVCGLAGPTKGTCVECQSDTDCNADTPRCNATSGTCVICLSSADCAGSSPVCDTDLSSCVRCDGDHGSKASHACPNSEAPLCFRAGDKAGSCGKCATDDDCRGQVGNICNVDSGLCAAGCRLDSDCSASEWCNDTTSMCTPKLENGTPLPSDPTRVAECSPDVGNAVCVSGACDAADNDCGFAPGDGPCRDSEQCRMGTCNATTNTCTGPCSTDADCAPSEYCSAQSVCAPKLPIGSACSAVNQCQSHDCTNQVCSELVASGSGIACATRALGSSTSDRQSHLGWFALLLGGVAVARRRRGRLAA